MYFFIHYLFHSLQSCLRTTRKKPIMAAVEELKELIIMKLLVLGEELLRTADHNEILLISRSIRDLHKTLEQLNGKPEAAQGGGAEARRRRRRLPPPPLLNNFN